MAEARSGAVRSPADVLRLAVAGAAWSVLLLVEALFGASLVGFATDLLRGFDAVDQDVLTVLVAVARVFALVVVVAAVFPALRRGTWRVVATLLVGASAGLAADGVAEAVIDERGGTLSELADELGPLTDGRFPTTAGLVITAAALTAMAPWSRRTVRRSSWAAMAALATAHFVTTPVSASSLAAVLSGWLGGSAAVVLFGAPAMRPTVASVIDGLRSVGLDVARLEPAKVDARGSTPYLGETTAGTGIFAKVLGRDERSADLLFRLYRGLVPRSFGDERPFSSLRRAVEHEALVSLVAAGHGVRTPAVEALADAEPGGFVLAYEAVAGRSLDRVDPDDIDDELLHQLWQQVATLRRRRTAHRDLRLANVFLSAGGDVCLIDFGFAELSASQLLLDTDVAELVTSLSILVAPRRVVAAAMTVLGAEAVLAARERVDERYLSGATRTAVRGRLGLLEEIRSAIDVGIADAEPSDVTHLPSPGGPSGSTPPAHPAR